MIYISLQLSIEICTLLEGGDPALQGVPGVGKHSGYYSSGWLPVHLAVLLLHPDHAQTPPHSLIQTSATAFMPLTNWWQVHSSSGWIKVVGWRRESGYQRGWEHGREGGVVHHCDVVKARDGGLLVMMGNVEKERQWWWYSKSERGEWQWWRRGAWVSCSLIVVIINPILLISNLTAHTGLASTPFTATVPSAIPASTELSGSAIE